mmetsp:Transcript_28964/g.78017  ORF Transcript_28964/g.78017 Transcript_28964/m.78017 type:complete len:204 (-) Transcript_28964:1849-2460(-)
MGVASVKAWAKLWNSGRATMSKKPTCDLVMPFFSRSMSGETVSSLAFSRSPCRKNSSSRYCTQVRCTLRGADKWPRSAHLSATWSTKLFWSSSTGLRCASWRTAASRGERFMDLLLELLAGLLPLRCILAWNMEWMAKCCFMSVASTMSMTSLRILSRSLLGALGMKLNSSLFMSWKEAARWWFSMGLRSLYSTARSSLTRTR